MKKAVPRVSVVMSVFNGERFLREAVNSVLRQTFRDFEFIVIDDGSTDGSRDVLTSIHDSRIVMVTNQDNMGLSSSLNTGVSIAQGEYVARMDADDISLPDRLQKQVMFLDGHPDIGVLGGAIQFINEQGEKGGLWVCPLSPLAAQWDLFFSPPVAHPAVLMRKSLLVGLGQNQVYDPAEDVLYAEDYDLWVRLGRITRIVSIRDVLVYYRQPTGPVSKIYSDQQMKSRLHISQGLISDFLQVGVPLDVVRFCMVPDHYSPLAGQALRLLFRLYREFVARNSSSFPERMQVRQGCTCLEVSLCRLYR
jgi:glycosyltransferase involved in cell wall biosynthesis